MWLQYRPKRVILDDYDSHNERRFKNSGVKQWLKRFLVLLLIIVACVSFLLWHSVQADEKWQQQRNTMDHVPTNCESIEHKKDNNKKALIRLNLNTIKTGATGIGPDRHNRAFHLDIDASRESANG